MALGIVAGRGNAKSVELAQDLEPLLDPAARARVIAGRSYSGCPPIFRGVGEQAAGRARDSMDLAGDPLGDLGGRHGVERRRNASWSCDIS